MQNETIERIVQENCMISFAEKKRKYFYISSLDSKCNYRIQISPESLKAFLEADWKYFEKMGQEGWSQPLRYSAAGRLVPIPEEKFYAGRC